MVNLYIILAGVLVVFLESSFITWPWYLLYCFVVLRRQVDNRWMYWLLALAIVVDILTFRILGFSAVAMVVLAFFVKFFGGNQSAFWYLEPVVLFAILFVWGRSNGFSMLMSVAFVVIFLIAGYLVRKKENFVSLR